MAQQVDSPQEEAGEMTGPMTSAHGPMPMPQRPGQSMDHGGVCEQCQQSK